MWGLTRRSSSHRTASLRRKIDPATVGAANTFRGKIYDYADVVQSSVARPDYPFPYFPGVMPHWDNTARKGYQGHVFHGAEPRLFEMWLRGLLGPP